MLQKIALISGVLLPLWNIPLIVRIVRRKSSEDISVAWALGVWFNLALMAPAAFVSPDAVWRAFSISNLSLFSLVVIFVLAYRKGHPKGKALPKEAEGRRPPLPT